MQNNIVNADEYFQLHQDNEDWFKLENTEKESILKKAELYINNALDLRNGTKEKDIYFHAICEQAIFLLTFDKERSKLQREGVTSYKVDDISFTMNQSIISPVAIVFLKNYTFKRLGEIL